MTGRNMDANSHSNETGEDKRGAQDVVSVVAELLERGVECGASDIHFEPTVSALVVKYRVDGVLTVVEKLPKSVSENVIARLKVLGGLLTYRSDIPQEGRINIVGAEGAVVDQRLSIFPTIHGQRAVLRLFYTNAELMDLEQLGFSGAVLGALRRIGSRNQGVLLLTGP